MLCTLFVFYLSLTIMKSKHWFTLLELLIVMTILALLFLLLLRTYNSIASLVFRVQQEKEVSQEILQISQIVQNFADRNTIDYTAYLTTGLLASEWITDVLYLSGQDGNISFFTSGNCIDPAVDYMLTGAWSGCSLYMTNSGTTMALINSNKIVISRAMFKIIPYASQQQYLDSDTLCEAWEYIQCINSPGFRMIFKAYSVNYGAQRATHVMVPFQQFF